MHNPLEFAFEDEVAPETANWDSGFYAYDGSGNITMMGADVFAYDKVSRIVESTVVKRHLVLRDKATATFTSVVA